jgi:hypothetical protein
MILIFKGSSKSFIFSFIFLFLSLQSKVLSQPSFQPDNTPRLPICDYNIVQGAQNELNKLVYDFKQKSDNESVWGLKIRLKETSLIYDAATYYNCDLKHQLQKPAAAFRY